LREEAVAKPENEERRQTRFGIGEWYGYLFASMDARTRQRYAELQHLKKKDRPEQPCPWRLNSVCTKDGGVCSLRLYQKLSPDKCTSVAPGPDGALRTTCPYRFQEGQIIFKWVGETVLGHSEPVIVSEVPFLERVETHGAAGTSEPESVGRIDNILVYPSLSPMSWCALEIQAVYFSGTGMRNEFKALLEYSDSALFFPVGFRRPDYRSSGPKRLMPQLQTKVPTLRRWGKKMAVVIDRSFFEALGPMDKVSDISNSDIAWFVVRYEERGQSAHLMPDFVQYTTLERAVEGLTGGRPVSLNIFEERIRAKMVR
jgi:hypothetical protein